MCCAFTLHIMQNYRDNIISLNYDNNWSGHDVKHISLNKIITRGHLD